MMTDYERAARDLIQAKTLAGLARIHRDKLVPAYKRLPPEERPADAETGRVLRSVQIQLKHTGNPPRRERRKIAALVRRAERYVWRAGKRKGADELDIAARLDQAADQHFASLVPNKSTEKV